MFLHKKPKPPSVIDVSAFVVRRGPTLILCNRHYIAQSDHANPRLLHTLDFPLANQCMNENIAQNPESDPMLESLNTENEC